MNKNLYLFLFCGLFIFSCNKKADTSSNEGKGKNEDTELADDKVPAAPTIDECKTYIQAWKNLIDTNPESVGEYLSLAVSFNIPDDVVNTWFKSYNAETNADFHAYFALKGDQLKVVLTDNYTDSIIGATNALPTTNAVFQVIDVIDEQQRFDPVSLPNAEERIQKWQSDIGAWTGKELPSDKSGFLRAFNVPIGDVIKNLEGRKDMDVEAAFALKSIASEEESTALEPEIIVIDQTGTNNQVFADISTPVPPLKPNFNLL